MNTKKREELTAADIWAMFAKTDEQMKKTDEKLKELCAESVKTDEKIKELCAGSVKTDEALNKLCAGSVKTDEALNKLCAESVKTDEKLNKLCGKVGGIDENLGHNAELYFQDALEETMMFGGEKYDKIYNNVLCGGKKNGMEFDIVLVNGKNVAIIEVKNRIHPNFVKELAEERVAKFRKYFPEYQKHKAYLGIAGFSFNKKVLEEAQKYGVGIIKQFGQSTEIGAEKLKAY